MARLTPLHLIPALIAAASHAGEVTIEPRPFAVEKSFTAAALPGGDCVLLKLDPKAWADFKIVQIAEHGATVAKGEVLIRFDSEDIDKKLVDARSALETAKLSLAQAELDSKILLETSPNKLESLRRAAEIAKEENAYFTQTRRKAAEESAAQALKRSEQILSNQREELKQLSKMYEADDITEDTEEIILVRQQDAVASAEFALRMETLDHKRTLSITLPREAKTLADSERDTSISQKKAELDIPRAIELNKLALVAFVDEATARTLKPELTGVATLAGREDVEIPIKLLKLAAAPAPDGTYRADLAVTWPKDLIPAAGATAQIRLISYQQPAAIVIPNKALDFETNGWTVAVKLADGKTERRPVKRGRVSKEETEILSGLEPGQVIIVP